ncbi:HdeD family acid-resistance protein [Methylobacter sp. S3L5C]|uniref:HdeD family acid-resistance protein n=1 Tax=Methylobacter sp. S3L5C TaxID=2839024 RepID=UPI001FAC1B8E|nr:DUF308 domain-containing protein [Methylobacter sp. S3L5C]UOA08652.1 DUF308 domain-containing protein [Methylobacter sp. S3L5C]
MNAEFNSKKLRQRQYKIHDHIQMHWKLYAAEGVLFIILGIAAYIVPHFIPKGVSVVLGNFLLVVGLLQLVRSLMFMTIPGLNLFLFTGLFQFAIGFYFLAVEPIKGRITLTMLLVILFIMESTIKVCLGFMMRRLAQWNDMLLNGVTSLILAVVIWIVWPETWSWPLGLLLGTNMILFGSSLLNISLNYKLVQIRKVRNF